MSSWSHVHVFSHCIILYYIYYIDVMVSFYLITIILFTLVNIFPLSLILYVNVPPELGQSPPLTPAWSETSELYFSQHLSLCVCQTSAFEFFSPNLWAHLQQLENDKYGSEILSFWTLVQHQRTEPEPPPTLWTDWPETVFECFWLLWALTFTTEWTTHSWNL